MAQGQGEGAVAAHGVAEDRLARGVGGEVGGDQGGQLGGDVALHAPVGGPGGPGGVQVEAGAEAEVPGVRLARDVVAARAGVGGDQHDPGRGGVGDRTGLDEEGLLGAGEAGEVGQDREGAGAGGAEDAEAHGAAGGGAGVAVEAHRAAEAGLLGNGGEGHQ